MSVLQNLFTKSPFSPLQSHMEKVAICIEKLAEVYEVLAAKDYERLEALTQEISSLEHAADVTKNEIRGNLPKGLFLAIHRGDLLEILAIQDGIADKAEDIAVLLTLKKLDPKEELKKDFKTFLDKNVAAVQKAHQIIREIDELLQASFGGREAEKVLQMVEEVAYMEHEADILQRDLLKKLYNMEDSLSYSSFHLWITVLQAVASLGNLAERLANRIRMLLEVK